MCVYLHTFLKKKTSALFLLSELACCFAYYMLKGILITNDAKNLH